MKGDSDVVLVGGVGTGRIFQWAHLRVYPQLLAKARLVGFHDVDQSRAREACDKYARMLEECAAEHPQLAEAATANIPQLRCYPTLEEMLEDVDLVDVCTHARNRMAIAIAALEKGVHSMVEKPMARTWIEADRAVRAFAERPDVYCQLNDDNVFDPRYQALHDLLAQGVIGAVQSMWLSRGSRLDSTTVLKSQASALDNGGGCLMDYGSHGLAGSWYVLGARLKPVKVEAVRISVLFPDRVLEGEPVVVEVDDNAQIKVLMEDPDTGSWSTVFLEASWTGGHIGPAEMMTGQGGGGFLRIEGDGGVINGSARDRLTVTRWDGGETVYPLREYPGETISFLHEIEHFIDCVRAGTPPEIDVDFGAEVIAICGSAYLSAIRGHAVTLDEFKEFSRGYVEKYGDNEQAEEALLSDLLAPYRREE
jgi:predicted dehydrogenase